MSCRIDSQKAGRTRELPDADGELDIPGSI